MSRVRKFTDKLKQDTEVKLTAAGVSPQEQTSIRRTSKYLLIAIYAGFELLLIRQIVPWPGVSPMSAFCSTAIACFTWRIALVFRIQP